jgi:hypothetical protein
MSAAGLKPQGRHPRGYRRVEADAYFTLDAPWIVPALLDRVAIAGRILEPCAGTSELRAHGLDVVAEDLHAHERLVIDFVESGADIFDRRSLAGFSWLVSNFPYGAQDRMLHSLLPIADRDGCGVALLTRCQWTCAQARRDIVHEHSHFTGQIVLTSRPVWIEGTRGGGKDDYAWIIWLPEPRPAGVAPFLKFAGKRGAPAPVPAPLLGASKLTERSNMPKNETSIADQVAGASADASPIAATSATGTNAGGSSAARGMRITIFEKPAEDGPLSKTIKLGANGEIVSDGSACKMWRGTARSAEVGDLSEFCAVIGSLSPQQAIALGSFKPGVGTTDGSPIPVVRKDDLTSAGTPKDAIARTKNRFEFPAGAPGVLPLDHDRKGMPSTVAAKLEAVGGFWAAVVSVAPGLARAARVERASTSAGLFNARTGKRYSASGGVHVYVKVQDIADIPRALDVLHDRLTLAGYGWAWVTDGGAIVVRSAVDACGASPEHLFFEGGPVCEPPLCQDAPARIPQEFQGEAVDTRAALPDLTAEETLTVRAMRAKAREAVKPEAEARRKPITAKRVAKVLARKPNASAATLHKHFMGAFDGRLPPDFELEFDDPAIGVKTVAEVMADMDRYFEETLADPLEGVANGPCKAMVMPSDAGGVFIHSFAHGGMSYRLMMDEAMVEHAVKTAAAGETLAVFVRCLDDALLFPGGEDRLVDICARLAGVGVRIVRAALKAHRGQREQEKRDAASRRRIEEEADGRIVVPAARKDAEVGATCLVIEEAMLRAEVRDTPMRGVNGRLAYISQSATPGAHLLTTQGSNGLPLAKGASPPAAPPEARLLEADAVQAPQIVERFVRFLKRDKDRGSVFVQLDRPFYLGLNESPASRLPTVRAIQTIPLVVRAPDGSLSILAKDGLDSELGLFFQIDPALRAAVPDPAKVTLAEAQAAYRFLTDDWLGDVPTNTDGKAALATLLMTIIERQFFPSRPAWFVTAPLPGTGKTTALNMVNVAANGTEAAACSWSGSPEERRKAIFAYLLAGASFVVWDNLERGAEVDCREINRVLTARMVEDRVLGQSRTRRADATTVQAFTGNAIRPVKDLATRSIIVALDAKCHDPENRPVKHRDPVGWTLAHRAEILGAALTILCLPRKPQANAGIRFVEWWDMVGQPVEMVANVRFGEMIGRNRAQDREEQDIVIVLTILHAEFGTRQFTAADVVGLLQPSFDDGTPEGRSKRVEAEKRAEALRDALNAVVRDGKPLGLDCNARDVGHKLGAIRGRPVEVQGWVLTLGGEDNARNNLYAVIVEV